MFLLIVDSVHNNNPPAKPGFFAFNEMITAIDILNTNESIVAVH